MREVRNRSRAAERSRALSRLAHRNGILNTCYSPNGDTYRGEWKDDMKDGRALRQTYRRSGLQYFGFFRNGKRHGYGVLTRGLPGDPDEKREYVGFWDNDKKHGFGRWFGSGTNFYEGNWHEGKKWGWGRMYYDDDAIYEGDWVDDKRHGEGLYKYPNGDVHMGFWRNDMKHGPGVIRFSRTGYVMEGIWNDDVTVCSTIHQNFHHHPETRHQLPQLSLAQPNAVLLQRCLEEFEEDEIESYSLPRSEYSWINEVLSFVASRENCGPICQTDTSSSFETPLDATE